MLMFEKIFGMLILLRAISSAVAKLLPGYKCSCTPRRKALALFAEAITLYSRSRVPMAAGIAFLLCGIVLAQWSVSSPDNSITVLVRNSPALQYSVTKSGTTAVNWSNIGIKLSSVDFSTGLTFVSTKDSSINETYPNIHGKMATHTNNCKVLILTFSKSSMQVRVLFRAYNAGAAYCYQIPGTGTVTVVGEASSYVLPANSTYWTMPQHPPYEELWRQTTGSVTGTVCFPALARTPDNIYVLLAEAGVYGTYCTNSLSPSGSTFRVILPQTQVNATLPWTSPWRVAVVGSLATIVDHTQELVENLNPPNEIEDVSWIKPGRVAWSWLTENVSDINQQKRYIDFANQLGWEYCLVDEGWRNINMNELSAYAKSKNVGLLLWFNKNEMTSDSAREQNLTQCVNYGVKGIKVDYIESDKQEANQFYDAMTQAAKDKKLMINFHGCISPRGMKRRWPNLMTQEGVRGAEWYRWSNTPTPEHNCIIPYTRNAVGEMDYTPTTFSQNRRITTDAHELALLVTYVSSWQHIADNPATYTAKTPNVLPFLREVPTSWDESRFIAGEPGQYYCVARRKGKRWFIAGINAATARTVTINLSFLGHGSYTTNLYSDFQVGSKAMQLAETNVTVPGSLQVTMQSNGGFCCYIDVAGTGTLESSTNHSIAKWLRTKTVGADQMHIFNLQGRFVSAASTEASPLLRQGVVVKKVKDGSRTQIVKFFNQ